MEHPIYIWSAPFIYGALHLYMEHSICICSTPFIYGALHLCIAALHLYMEHSIYIRSTPFVYVVPFAYAVWHHVRSTALEYFYYGWLWGRPHGRQVRALCGPASCRICYFSKESWTWVITTLAKVWTKSRSPTVLEIWCQLVLGSAVQRLRSLWSHQIFQEQCWKSPLKLTLCQHWHGGYSVGESRLLSAGRSSRLQSTVKPREYDLISLSSSWKTLSQVLLLLESLGKRWKEAPGSLERLLPHTRHVSPGITQLYSTQKSSIAPFSASLWLDFSIELLL